MEIDYSMYAQLSGIPLMPQPQIYYPENGGGMQWQAEKEAVGQPRVDMSDNMTPMPNRSHFQAARHESYHEPPRAMENMSDGFQTPRPPNQNRYLCSSASEYRCFARNQRRAREMNSRNGLYSPMDSTARFSGGDSNNFSNYSGGYNNMGHQDRNSYW